MSAIDTTLPSSLEAAPLAEMVNHTRHPAQYFQHVDPSGEAFHVVVARLTYDLHDLDPATNEPRIAPRQQPLITQDVVPDAEAGILDLVESDFAPYKPRCDLLLRNITAYTPDEQAHDRFAVGVRLGPWQKVIHVTGPRL